MGVATLSFAFTQSGSTTGLWALRVAGLGCRCWNCQISVNVTSVRVECEPDDFTPGIDRARGLQKQSGGSGYETVEIDERSVLAHERAKDTKVRVCRSAHDLTFIINAKRETPEVAADYTQVFHFPGLRGPQECVSRLVAGQIGATDHSTEIIDTVSHVVSQPSQTAEVGGHSVLPKQSMNR